MSAHITPHKIEVIKRQDRRGSHWERGVESTGSTKEALVKRGYLTLESKNETLNRWFVVDQGKLSHYASEEKEQKQMQDGEPQERSRSKSSSFGFGQANTETFELTTTTKLGVFQSSKVRDVPIFLVTKIFTKLFFSFLSTDCVMLGYR